MDEPSERAFEQFVAARGTALLRFAYLLAGDRDTGEDLLQSALERCYRQWARVERSDRPERYVRRILANAAIDRWRLTRRTPETRLSERDAPTVADHAETLSERDVLVRALRALSPRQRVVVVLRYVEDLSEAETAALLDCSPGSVKSHASRGLARLRDRLAGPPDPAPPDPSRPAAHPGRTS